MTSFFLCNDDWEKETEVTLIEMDSSPEVDSWVMESTKLSELVEEEGQKLLYVFDYLTERSFFMEAYQLTGSLVVLVLALVVGQATGVLYLGVGTVMIVGTLIWIVDGVLIYLSVHNFKRSSLIAKL